MTIDRWLWVIGVLVTWFVSRYFYKRADRQRRPTFVVKPTRRVLTDPGLMKLQGLSVLHRGQRIGEHGITEAEIYFWNSGTLPILRAEVLEPFGIIFPVSILQYDLVKSSREAVNIEVIGDEVVRPKALTLQFAVLEPGDGGTIRIIYDGPPEVPIEFRGACLDAPKPAVLPSTHTYFTTPSERRFQLLAPLLTLPAALAGGGVFVLLLFGGKWLLEKALGPRAAPVEEFLRAGGIVFVVLLVLLSLLFSIWDGYKKFRAKYVPPDIKP